MDTRISTNREFKRMCTIILSSLVVLIVAFSVTAVAYAAPDPPFLGHWEATDVDGSEMGLSIGGRPTGPFQITWTDDYISFCNGEAGIVRGTGSLNEIDPNLLEADIHLECFRSGATLDFHVTFRYHPVTDTFSVRWSFDNQPVTIWHRPGGGQVQEPPMLGLRVNYGHDWVESLYEAGHVAWLTVTDSDGNVKATAELVTEAKEYWGGETGFHSLDGIWFDVLGNQMDYPPDIQPYDWVYGWVDNGASAQVQIGEINAAFDMETDSINGTVLAEWFNEDLFIVCDPWGLSDISQYRESSVYPDGVDEYECAWSEVLEFDMGQELGVWYYGSDGHAVANAFPISSTRIHASVTGNFFFMTDFNPGRLSISIYESTQEDAALLWSAEVDTDGSGFVHLSPEDHGLNLMPGNYLLVSDGRILKGLVLDLISLDVFDLEQDTMAGTAPAGSEVMVIAAPGPETEVQTVLNVSADPETGAWLADFSLIGFDITEEMREWSFAEIYDQDGDTNETSTLPLPPPPTFMAYMPTTIVGYNWPIGDAINLSVNEGEYTAQATVGNADWDPTIVLFELWQDDIFMEAGDHIVMTDENAGLIKEVWITNLAVIDFDLDAGQVFGTYDPAYDLWTWLFDLEGQVPAMDPDHGTWVATFSELPPGAWGGATQSDADGDGTSIDFQVPNLRVVIANEPDWVNSGITVSAGQTFRIEASGLMNPCLDTYPNGADYCILYTPIGGEGVVPYENEYGIFPGPGLRFMGLLGRVGDGEPFYIGEGGPFTAEQTDMLWFTPNDNLRTDNQGAYSVLVWLGP